MAHHGRGDWGRGLGTRAHIADTLHGDAVGLTVLVPAVEPEEKAAHGKHEAETDAKEGTADGSLLSLGQPEIHRASGDALCCNIGVLRAAEIELGVRIGFAISVGAPAAAVVVAALRCFAPDVVLLVKLLADARHELTIMAHRVVGVTALRHGPGRRCHGLATVAAAVVRTASTPTRVCPCAPGAVLYTGRFVEARGLVNIAGGGTIERNASAANGRGGWVAAAGTVVCDHSGLGSASGVVLEGCVRLNTVSIV